MNLTIRNEPMTEHAVVMCLRMSDPNSRSEHERIAGLASRIQSSVHSVSQGEFGGIDTRGGYCLLYCYGRDADEGFGVISPLIDAYGAEPGSWAIKRFGAATDVEAPRERVELVPGDPS